MASLWTKKTAESAGSSPYEYDSLTIGSGNTIAPSTDQAAAGSYSYKVTLGGTSRDARMTENFSTVTEFYRKFRVYIDSISFAAYESGYICTLTTGDYGTLLLGLKVGRAGGTAVDRWYTVGQGLANQDSTTNFSFDAWHTVEVYWKQGSGSAIHRVTIDGTVIREQTTGTSANSATQSAIGHIGGDNPTGGTLYFDEDEAYDAIPSSGSVVPRIMQAMNQFTGGLN